MKKFSCIILDLDGVVTDTRSLHAKAWKEMFDSFLQENRKSTAEKGRFKEFSLDEDYEQFVDGKPRYDGVRSFLESRNINLPEGHSSDSPEAKTICGLGNKKNQIFQRLLKEKGPLVFEDAVKAIKAWRKENIPLAIVSSSKNCSRVLNKAQLKNLFDVQIDGVVGEEKGLKGKPSPDYFLEAAKTLGCSSRSSILVEDALSGIEAGHSGGFGWVVAMNRSHHVSDHQKFFERGAHQVISSLEELQKDIKQNDLKAAAS